ncbi:uncharacterized protein ACN2A1_002056 [Glossina fuscipes fuscipes]
MKILILCIIYYLVPNVLNECILEIPANKEIAPVWKKKIGSRWFKIPHITNRLKLQDGEIIHGYCATKFKNIRYNIQHEINFDCDDYDYGCKANQMYIETRDEEISGKNVTIKCSNDSLTFESRLLEYVSAIECNDVKWIVNVKSVQNSETETSWCKENHQILELSVTNTDQHHTLAHICYDLEDFSLQSLKYKTIKRTTEPWNPNKFLPVVLDDLPEASTLSSEVKFPYETVLHTENDVLQHYLERLGEKNPWLKLAHFEYANIIQSSPFIKQFNQYYQLLDILWWRNLRVTNWQRFLNALEEHITVYSYTIYMGVAGTVQIPLWSNPDEFQYLQVQNGYVNTTVPQYIWMYLESSDDKNPDVYVFGYNSPYAEFFHSKEVQFCSDTCSDFDWLKNVRSSFHYDNFGIVFCCSPESVKMSAHGGKLPYKLSSPALDEAANISRQEEKVIKLEEREETVESTEKAEVVEKSVKLEEPTTPHKLSTSVLDIPENYVTASMEEEIIKRVKELEEITAMSSELEERQAFENFVYARRVSAADWSAESLGYH